MKSDSTLVNMLSLPDKELIGLIQTGTADVGRVTDLIYQGADVNKPLGNDVLVKSLVHHPKLLRALIQHGAEMTIPKTFPGDPNVMMIAIQENQIESVREILKYACINLEYKTFYGETAVLIAARKGNVEIMDALLKMGGNLYVKDYDKSGVMHYASVSKSPEMVKYLMERKVNPNVQNCMGVTALMNAVDNYVENTNQWNFAVLRELAKVSDFQIKDLDGKDAFERLIEDYGKEISEHVKSMLWTVLKEEMESRMKGLIMASKREDGIPDLPDDVLLKISTMGLDDVGTKSYVEKKYMARKKMQEMLRTTNVD
jgi:hypothetical protein